MTWLVALVSGDPVPVVGGAATVVIIVGVVARFLNGWLSTILDERRDLGGVYKDALNRQTDEIANLKSEHSGEIASLKTSYEHDIAEVKRRLDLTEESERECYRRQEKLLGEIAEGRKTSDELRRELGRLGALVANQHPDIDLQNTGSAT